MGSMQFFHAGTKVETLNGKTTITVNGKDIDLNSAEGRKILREMGKKLHGFDGIVEDILASAEKIRNKIEKIFEI